MRGVAGSLGLAVAAAGLTFANGVLLARELGAASYGIYASAIAVVLLLSVPLTLGFDRLLIRDVATAGTRNEWSLAQGLLRRALQGVLPISIVAGLAVGIAAWLGSDSLSNETLLVLWIALPMVPLMTLTYLRRAVTLGLQRIVSAQLPDGLLRPGIFFVFLVVAYLVFSSMTAAAAMALNLLSVILAFVVGMYLLWREMPDAMRAARPEFRTRAWIGQALPFALLTAVLTLMNQIDVVLVAGLAGAAPAGLYSVAARGAALALFGAIAVNVTVAPTAAQLWAQGDVARLQHVVTRASRGAFFFALAVAIVLWIAGPRFLLLFGEEFVPANQTLAILALAQVVDCAFGIGGLMLSMTGLQTLGFVAVLVAATSRVVIDLALIPSLGPTGAAIAAVISIALFNGLTAVFTARRLAIDPTPIGVWRRRSA